ncbi:hypothetical protein Nepgr_022928 [Nepenthes gracilis]|uniref:Uncharacterized protein n=1 Tax=Nepenthes gracilis TaxID=150966 RepID=A0AAD3T1U9_NEPGR|nr:hypothetical protein Nepgr_022928 [Nepenthes gracilis]
MWPINGTRAADSAEDRTPSSSTKSSNIRIISTGITKIANSGMPPFLQQHEGFSHGTQTHRGHEAYQGVVAAALQKLCLDTMVDDPLLGAIDPTAVGLLRVLGLGCFCMKWLRSPMLLEPYAGESWVAAVRLRGGGMAVLSISEGLF